MNDVLVVLCNCGNVDEAERIAGALVEEHLAACVNILPVIRSVYRWNGAIEQAAEIPLIIKTSGSRFESLRARIRQLHSYEVPEIVALSVAEGDRDYLAWWREQL